MSEVLNPAKGWVYVVLPGDMNDQPAGEAKARAAGYVKPSHNVRLREPVYPGTIVLGKGPAKSKKSKAKKRGKS